MKLKVRVSALQEFAHKGKPVKVGDVVEVYVPDAVRLIKDGLASASAQKQNRNQHVG